MTERKIYLEDGAYAEFDGLHFIITTEDGINTIYLEVDALISLVDFANSCGMDL